MDLENTQLGLKAKMGYSLVSILVLTFITQFAADGYIGIDDFFVFILIIYTISIIPIVIVYHFVKIYLRNTNDSEKIQTRAEIEFASQNYTKALSLYKKLGDLEKISSCVEHIEKTKVSVKRVEIIENDSSQPANLQVQDSVVTGEINYIVNEPSDEVALQSQIEADDENVTFQWLWLIACVSALLLAQFFSGTIMYWLIILLCIFFLILFKNSRSADKSDKKGAEKQAEKINPLSFILLGILISAIITAAFKDWLIG